MDEGENGIIRMIPHELDQVMEVATHITVDETMMRMTMNIDAVKRKADDVGRNDKNQSEILLLHLSIQHT